MSNANTKNVLVISYSILHQQINILCEDNNYTIHTKMYLSISVIKVNSFTANIADQRRHSRLPTSPIGDLDPLLLPYSSPFVYRHHVVFKVFMTLILQI